MSIYKLGGDEWEKSMEGARKNIREAMDRRVFPKYRPGNTAYIVSDGVFSEEITKMNPQFYMIHVDGGGAPRQKHSTLDVAKAEAERLSLLNVGKMVYVLAHAETCIARQPIPEWQGSKEKDFFKGDGI
jgi:hypothetical protein